MHRPALAIVRAAALLAALLGGIGEFAALQRSRLQDRRQLRRLRRA